MKELKEAGNIGKVETRDAGERAAGAGPGRRTVNGVRSEDLRGVAVSTGPRKLNIRFSPLPEGENCVRAMVAGCEKSGNDREGARSALERLIAKT